LKIDLLELTAAGVAGVELVSFAVPETDKADQRFRGSSMLREHGSLLRKRSLICCAMTIGFGQATFFAYLPALNSSPRIYTA
jgi:hypothetical protein